MVVQQTSTNMGTLIAPLWMQPFAWKQNPVLNYNVLPDLQEPRRNDPVRGNLFQNNPRDNLVTMIAMTTGEEGFIDENNNGTYDPPEPFLDLPEPFVDSNDNGTWDPDERWVDADGNGSWTPKNGTFDRQTLIWTSERILWTGLPHPADYVDTVSPTAKQIPNGIVSVPRLGTTSTTLIISDPWFNSLAQNSGGDGCKFPSDIAMKVSGAKAGAPNNYTNSWEGEALSYVSPNIRTYDVTDIRRTNPDGGLEPPGPVVVVLTGGCQFTGSPSDGYTYNLPLTISGQLPQ